MKDFRKLFVLFTAAITIMTLICSSAKAEEYIQVTGLLDIRTDFSDGSHSLGYLIQLAKKRGFCVLFINDHDRKTLEYGIRPFQNILKKKVEEPSINKGDPENYLNMIESVARKYPEMILIPGAESSPFYYWKGSYFKRNLTVYDWERHLLVIGLEKPGDYRELPVLHNGYSTRYVFSSLQVSFLFLFIPLILGLYLVRGKGKMRYAGIALLILTLLLIINNHPFKSSPYNQYQGYQGISPYQLLIDYVDERGGMTFWNHPETRSGVGTLGPISRNTAPYPEVLSESSKYTGFSALYGERRTVTEPGNIWDKVLIEYCWGTRERPVWGLSTADFHEEGGAGEKLGNYPTIFLVKAKAKHEILEAMKKGRMYAYRGDIDLPRLILEDFSVSGTEASQKGIMGEEVILEGYPTLNIALSAQDSETGSSMTVRVIRAGHLLKTVSGKAPLRLQIRDDFYEPGQKTYYRLDVNDDRGRKIISNPIFVRFGKNK